MAWMFRRDLPFFLMGAIYIFLGLMMMIIFARDRADMTNISFALFAISVGLYGVCRTELLKLLPAARKDVRRLDELLERQ